MNPVYVDNFSTAMTAIVDAYEDEFNKDENFKCSPHDSETERFRKMNVVISELASRFVNQFGLLNLSYLHVWFNEKGQLAIAMPRNVPNRDWAIKLLENALRLARIAPFSQDEAREARG